ncbi:MAG: cytochrome b/b6 domain-containing protein [Bacteroidales bacterium]
MYLYPKWVRLWHVTNAILFVILIITGISMQYTGRDNNMMMVGFARAVKWHNICAFILTANYVFYIIGNAVTTNGKYYKVERRGFIAELVSQAKYYAFGMFKGQKHPFPVTLERKFNPLQKFTYVLAMYLGMPLLIISGFGLLFPEITVERVFGGSGLVMTDVLHISMGFLLSVFMVIHVYTCTLGSKPTSLFKGMITGYHDSDHH